MLFKDDLAALNELVLVRKVYRKIQPLYSNKNIQASWLVAEITAELPIQLNGQNIVLSGQTPRWLEETPATHNALPIEYSYRALTHPQSATNGVGLFCQPLYEGAEAFHLSFGKVAGFYPDIKSNVSEVFAQFPDQETCEKKRSELLMRFGEEDLDNWRTIVTVNRKVESVLRYIIDNSADALCQEIQLEQITTTLAGVTFTGMKASFPLRTIELSKCGSAATSKTH